MKKFFFFATALFAAISFSACSDDDDNDGGGSSAINYVSEVVCQDSSGWIITHKFEYDDQNRLTKVTEKRNGDEERVLFPDQGRDWVFNEKGYLIYEGGDIYEYDDKDYLIERRHYLGLETKSFIWENGDCIQWRSNVSGENTVLTYSNHIANLNFEIWQLCHLSGYWKYAFTGRKSRHLLQKEANEYGDILLYECEFDEKGRPVTIYDKDYFDGKIFSTCKVSYKE